MNKDSSVIFCVFKDSLMYAFAGSLFFCFEKEKIKERSVCTHTRKIERWEIYKTALF